jgi:hypothetical protein
MLNLILVGYTRNQPTGGAVDGRMHRPDSLLSSFVRAEYHINGRKKKKPAARGGGREADFFSRNRPWRGERYVGTLKVDVDGKWTSVSLHSLHTHPPCNETVFVQRKAFSCNEMPFRATKVASPSRPTA